MFSFSEVYVQFALSCCLSCGLESSLTQMLRDCGVLRAVLRFVPPWCSYVCVAAWPLHRSEEQEGCLSSQLEPQMMLSECAVDSACLAVGLENTPEDLGNTLWIGKPTLPFLYEVKLMEGVHVSHIFSYLLVV